MAQFFPSLSHAVMCQILQQLSFSPVIVTLIESYFQDRVTTYKWDSAQSKQYDFSLGTPQGDCLSLFFFFFFLKGDVFVTKYNT